MSSEENWNKFGDDWKLVLRAAWIEHFHMTDFESRWGQFEGWSDKKRIPLIQALTSLIRNHGLIAITSGVYVVDYAQVAPEALDVLPTDPYHFCLQYCIGLAGSRLEACLESVRVPRLFSTHRGTHTLEGGCGPKSLSSTNCPGFFLWKNKEVKDKESTGSGIAPRLKYSNGNPNPEIQSPVQPQPTL